MKSGKDADLVARLRAGDTGAFDAAYARYAPRLFRFLVRLCGRAAAEDVLQEAWLKLATRAGELSPDTELAAWLFTVARNAWLGRARTEGRLVELARADDVADAGPSPEVQATTAKDVVAVERALAALGVTDREALLLVGVEGMTPAVAAGVVGISDLAFRQRLHRARVRLQAELERPPRRAAGDRNDP